MRRHFSLLLICAALAAVSACSNSPSSPSMVGGGATINGSLVAASSDTGSTNARTLGGPSPAVSVPPGLTVSVGGTNVTTTVDPNGQWVLRNVPAGTIELRFNGQGVTATVTLTNLQNGQTATITVSLPNANTATVESDRRRGVGDEEVEGRVESLPPTTPALSLVVAGQAVTTDASTQFFIGGAAATFSDLAIGQRVHVKGSMSGGSLLAKIVMIQNTNTGGGLNLNGIISNFSGTPSAFQFDVNGSLVKGDAATVFFGNSDFTELANGVRVEVKGAQRDGFVYAQRIHVNIEETEVEFSGVITSISGTAPTLTLVVGGRTVTTTSSTEVKRQGDEQTVLQLQVGQTVDVSGALQLDGSVKAKKISIEGDAVGGLFEMEGTLAGKSGACPTIAFSVSGYSITTTATTVFVPNCSALSNGTKVLVKGVVQAGGSVTATRVEKN